VRNGVVYSRFAYADGNPVTFFDVNGYFSVKGFVAELWGATKSVAEEVTTEVGGAIVSGVKFAWDAGYRTSNEVVGAISGAVKARVGESAIGAPIKAGVAHWVADKILDMTLDAIEGKAEELKWCSWIPYAGKSLCRYHTLSDDYIDEHGNVWVDGVKVGIRLNGRYLVGDEYKAYSSRNSQNIPLLTAKCGPSGCKNFDDPSPVRLSSDGNALIANCGPRGCGGIPYSDQYIPEQQELRRNTKDNYH
jgi:hypothetical protein